MACSKCGGKKTTTANKAPEPAGIKFVKNGKTYTLVPKKNG